MKWTALWTATLVGMMAAANGTNAYGMKRPIAKENETHLKMPIGSIASGECTQLSDFFSELLALTNRARREAGIEPLKFSYQLGQAAQGYAEDLATYNFFSHVGPDGSTMLTRIEATGYDFVAAGENIAAGQRTAASVFEGWMNSPGHRANILKSDYTEVGFGRFDAPGSSDYGQYWVQNFGKPQQGATGSAIYIPDTCRLSLVNGRAKPTDSSSAFVDALKLAFLREHSAVANPAYGDHRNSKNH